MTIAKKTIFQKAQSVKDNVAKNYKLGESTKWSYFFAKEINNLNKDIKEIKYSEAPKQHGTHISRQIPKEDYKKIAKNMVSFVENKKTLPNYCSWGQYQIATNLYTYMFARIIAYYNSNKVLPNYVEVNSKCFTKPVETKNSVYNRFVSVFGDFGNTIDGALGKVLGTGYGSYYDDKMSNFEAIASMKANNQNNKPNCTDACHVFYNIMLQLIALGKYKKVECLHVMCSSGGHVKLKITNNDGTTFIRDPACVISKNGKPLNAVWCTNTPIAVNPAWFMQNLYR